MNVGFSNLNTLKQHLLAPSLVAATDYDVRLALIGQGVAKSFERFCNCKFQYKAGEQEVFSANRSFWFTNRIPVSVFTKVELRYFRTDDWVDISGQPLATDEDKGYIDFGYTLGRAPMQARVTYNGGLWWEQAEPTDHPYPTPTPDDIANNAAGLDPEKFMLQADLQNAWVIQCRKVWEAIDKIGDKISDVGSNTKNPTEALAGLSLVPDVRDVLLAYRRFQLT